MCEQVGIVDMLSHLERCVCSVAIVRTFGVFGVWDVVTVVLLEVVEVLSAVGVTAVVTVLVILVVAVSGSKLFGSVTFSGGQYTSTSVEFLGL